MVAFDRSLTFANSTKFSNVKVYSLQLFDEVVSCRSEYKYFTKLDLTMMYYSFMLDDASKDLCTIVAPYGKYKYNRLAMGLKPAPDVAQYYITKTLKDLDVEIYIDDVGIFSNTPTKNT